MNYLLLASVLFSVLGVGLWCVRNDRHWVAMFAGAICALATLLVPYMSERV